MVLKAIIAMGATCASHIVCVDVVVVHLDAIEHATTTCERAIYMMSH